MAVAPVVDEGPAIIQSSERRIVIPTNILTAIVLAVVGYWVGEQLGNSFMLNDAQNTGVLLGYSFASIMFLVGIGFANYPLARLFGWRVTPQPAGDDHTGAWRYFNLSLDHKVIGVQYLVAMLMAMLFGGIGAMLIRTALLVPDPPIVAPDKYLTLVSMHSVMMVFVASAAIVGPFGNFFVPLHDRDQSNGVPAARGLVVLARAARDRDPARGADLRRLPDRLDRVQRHSPSRRTRASTATSSASR